MRSVFANHFASDEETRQKLWDECLFVFDTNILTSLYKRSDDARDALIRIIESLGDRVWIPHQVAYEFLKNRPSIAHDQAGMYSDAIQKLSDFVSGLESHIQHPFVPADLHAEFVGVSSKVIAALQGKVAYYDDRIVSDDLKERLADLLEGKVGSSYSADELKAKIKDGEGRYANKVPPGYKDVDKHKGSTVFEHVRARYGDLILWCQMLDHAKQASKAVILITGDQKDDWWLRVGGKTIGPRPELVEEFRATVGADFFMYSHSSFLSLANSYLDQKTSDTVIREIEDAAQEDEVFVVSDSWGGLVTLESLKERERLLKKDFESSALNYTKIFADLIKAPPELKKELKREIGIWMTRREALRKELNACRDEILRWQQPSLDDLV